MEEMDDADSLRLELSALLRAADRARQSHLQRHLHSTEWTDQDRLWYVDFYRTAMHSSASAIRTRWVIASDCASD